jgi:hypothetical protein
MATTTIHGCTVTVRLPDGTKIKAKYKDPRQFFQQLRWGGKLKKKILNKIA